jgi:hypothetical protein
MDADTTTGEVIGFMVVVGAGIGLVMQVLVLAVQNAVPRRHLGTATSAAQFFRSIGGTVGVATFGALVNARPASRLAGLDLPGGIDPQALLSSPTEIARLPEVPLRNSVHAPDNPAESAPGMVAPPA